jgi:hypothetical protein
MTTSTVEKIKLWVFPSLVSIIGVFIYQEIKEIKSDVKSLLAQSNIDKTRIDNLERQLYTDNKSITANPFKESNPPRPLRLMFAEFIPAKDETDVEEQDNEPG